MNQLQRKLTEDKMEKREKDEELAFLTDQVEKLCSEKVIIQYVLAIVLAFDCSHSDCQ